MFRSVSTKCPSRLWDGDNWLAGRTEEKWFLDEGSLIGPPGKSMILYKKETQKIELVARPGGKLQGRRGCHLHANLPSGSGIHASLHQDRSHSLCHLRRFFRWRNCFKVWKNCASEIGIVICQFTDFSCQCYLNKAKRSAKQQRPDVVFVFVCWHRDRR